MRRVYYSYAVSISTHVMFWQGMFLGAAALLLAKWLHVASIIKNFLSVPVGSAPQFVVNSIWGALTHGEVLMVVTFVLSGVVALSCGYRISQAIVPTKLWLVSRA